MLTILYCNNSFKIRFPVVKRKGENARKAFGRYGFYNSKPTVQEVGIINSPFCGSFCLFQKKKFKKILLHLP